MSEMSETSEMSEMSETSETSETTHQATRQNNGTEPPRARAHRAKLVARESDVAPGSKVLFVARGEL